MFFLSLLFSDSLFRLSFPIVSLAQSQGAMRQSGYSDTATNEVHAALSVLAKYGVLGIGVGLQNGTHQSPLSFLGVSELQQSSAAAAAANAASGVYGAVGQLNLDSYLHGAGTATPRTSIERYDATFDPFRHPGTQAATPMSINNNAFGLTSASALNAAAAAQSLGSLSKSPTPAEMTTSKEKNVEIPEVIVGAILGKSPPATLDSRFQRDRPLTNPITTAVRERAIIAGHHLLSSHFEFSHRRTAFY